MAKLQAASVPIGWAAARLWQLRHGTDRRTDGRIALFQNASIGLGHDNSNCRQLRAYGSCAMGQTDG